MSLGIAGILKYTEAIVKMKKMKKKKKQKKLNQNKSQNTAAKQPRPHELSFRLPVAHDG